MPLHPRFARGGYIFGEGVGCQGDDRQRIRLDPLFANSTRGFIPVAIGHLDIHQHQIKGARAHDAVDDHRDRFISVMSGGHILPAALQHFADQHAVDVMILNQKDASKRRQVFHCRCGLWRLRRVIRRNHCRGQDQRKARASAAFAFNLN